MTDKPNSPAVFPFLIVPYPTSIPASYGINATSGPNGCWLQCRGTKPEREKIQKAAYRIGVTYGEFMRRLCNDAADYILENFPPLEEE